MLIVFSDLLAIVLSNTSHHGVRVNFQPCLSNNDNNVVFAVPGHSAVSQEVCH